MDHWLVSAAARRPERVALRDADGPVGDGELLARAGRGAAPRRARGAPRGAPVAPAPAPGRAFAEALHGCLLLGAPAPRVAPRLPPPDRAALLRGVAVCVDGPLEAAPDAPAEPPPAAE